MDRVVGGELTIEIINTLTWNITPKVLVRNDQHTNCSYCHLKTNVAALLMQRIGKTDDGSVTFFKRM